MQSKQTATPTTFQQRRKALLKSKVCQANVQTALMALSVRSEKMSYS